MDLMERNRPNRSDIQRPTLIIVGQAAMMVDKSSQQFVAAHNRNAVYDRVGAVSPRSVRPACRHQTIERPRAGSGWLDSNQRPPAPKAGALPTALQPVRILYHYRMHCATGGTSTIILD